jgi:hypothetical protein
MVERAVAELERGTAMAVGDCCSAAASRSGGKKGVGRVKPVLWERLGGVVVVVTRRVAVEDGDGRRPELCARVRERERENVGRWRPGG